MHRDAREALVALLLRHKAAPAINWAAEKLMRGHDEPALALLAAKNPRDSSVDVERALRTALAELERPVPGDDLVLLDFVADLARDVEHGARSGLDVAREVSFIYQQRDHLEALRAWYLVDTAFEHLPLAASSPEAERAAHLVARAFLVRHRPQAYLGSFDDGPAPMLGRVLRELASTSIGDATLELHWTEPNELVLRGNLASAREMRALIDDATLPQARSATLRFLVLLASRGDLSIGAGGGRSRRVVDGHLEPMRPSTRPEGWTCALTLDLRLFGDMPQPHRGELARAAALTAAFHAGAEVKLVHDGLESSYRYPAGLGAWLLDWGAPPHGTVPRRPACVRLEGPRGEAELHLAVAKGGDPQRAYFVRSFVNGRETEAGGSHLEAVLRGLEHVAGAAAHHGLLLVVSASLADPTFAGPTRARLVNADFGAWLEAAWIEALRSDPELVSLVRHLGVH